MTYVTITSDGGSDLNIQPSKLNLTSASESVAVDEGSVPDVAATQFRLWRCGHSAVFSARGAILSGKRAGRSTARKGVAVARYPASTARRWNCSTVAEIPG